MSYAKTRYAALPAPSTSGAKSFVDDYLKVIWANRWELSETDAEGEPVRKSGLVIGKGKDIEADAALQKMGIPTFSYQHRGGGKRETYWHLRSATFYWLITGVYADYDMQANLALRSGFAYARQDQGNGDSILKIVGICDELWMAGYKHPISFSVKARMAFGHFLKLLVNHYRALETLQGLPGYEGSPAFYEVGMTLKPGAATQFGQNATATVVPPASDLPEEIDRDYIANHYIGRKSRADMLDLIEAEDGKGITLIDKLVEWSITESKRIYEYSPNGAKGVEGVAGANAEARSFVHNGGRAPQQNTSPEEDLPF